jgi:serine/threonine-protein kinase PpkA
MAATITVPASLAWRRLGGGGQGAERLDPAPRIAGFELLREIGTGRRSSAWLAHDAARRLDVVLKLQPASVSTLHREWAIAAQAAGDDVVQVHGHGRAGEWEYLVMEHLSGGNLAGRIRRGCTQGEAMALLAQCAAPLARLHAQGIVHRDVKPANFLLRADGGVVLADFGLAAPAGTCAPSLGQGAIVGTPRYVAPEQLQGAPATPAADVYGLGVLLYEMLCGRPPFAGATLMEVLAQHLMADAPRLPDTHAALQPLLDRMLAKEVQRRLPDAGAVLGLLGPEGSP